MKAIRERKKLRPKTVQPTSSLAKQDWEAGRRVGYSTGWSYGYHMGRCQRVLRDIPQESGILWDQKIMYVRAVAAPYVSIDGGIEDGLRKLVREVIVVNPEDNFVSIAEETRPDLVLMLFTLAPSFPVDKVQALRSLGIRTAIWLSDDPYHTDQTIQIAPHYDYVFTLEISCVDVYKSLGCLNVHYLPFGINPDSVTLDHVSTSYRRDICFIGTAFWNRVHFIDEIADYLKDKDIMINGFWWDRLRSYDKLSSKIQGYWLDPKETAKHYHASKIVINLHRSIDDESHNSNSRRIPAYSPNPRVIDIAACGTLQLTDVRQELSNLYTPGEELDTFSSPQELVAKIEYYLNHEEERQRIALKGLSRTLRDHTYRGRLHQMMTIINGG